LNYEFGWVPLVSDIRKAAYAVKHHNKIIKQYLRDAGKSIRRRYTFPSEYEYTEDPVTIGVQARPLIGSTFYSSLGSLRSYTTTTRKTWFSGAFTYYLHLSDEMESSLLRSEELANTLLGTRLTPEVLWNLTPWTWLLDWISNIGQIMSNVQSFLFDGDVVRYAYIMETTVISKVYILSGLKFKSGQNGEITQRFTTTIKRRRRATPYGFGLKPLTDFSAKQWAILAALGITQGGGRYGW
jgi:hypothetical protein